MSKRKLEQFDYIVIGAGSGGIASARRAAQYGKRVLVIENRVVGGTCVNVGCVPKKVMFNLASYLEDSQHYMEFYGVKSEVKLDFAQFKKNRDAYVHRLNEIYLKMIAKSDITYVEGLAHFKSKDTVAITVQGNPQEGPPREIATYSAPHILIASGGYPSKSDFPGADLCIDSNGVFDLEVLPKSMVVIGGGYIGIEIAQIMNSFGVKVTLVVREIMLRFVDQEVVQVLCNQMKLNGIDLRLHSPHESVQKEGDHLSVKLKNGEKIQCNSVLLAIGRPPNVKQLCLDKTQVTQHKSGHIIVDEFQNTVQKGIYAVGDVTTAPALTPVAIRAGRILSERLFNGKTSLKANFDHIPTVIFSHPPIGTVGISEQEAEKKFGKNEVTSYKSSFTNMFYSLMKPDNPQRPKSLFKIICHKEKSTKNGKLVSHSERVVGVHSIGRGVDEMMQTVAVAMKMGATKQDFDNVIAVHPTASEELVLMNTKYI